MRRILKKSSLFWRSSRKVSTHTIHRLKVHAHAILDSRGTPTVAVELSNGVHTVTASVPSSKEASERGAREVRDDDGVHVDTAVANVNGPIAGVLRLAPLDPILVDRMLVDLDGTKDKSRLGANAILPVSIAMRRLAALHEGIPLWRYIAHESNSLPAFPRLYMNMLNGGVHADFRLPFEEYLVVINGRDPEAMYKKATTIFGRLGRIVSAAHPEVRMGELAGYAPAIAELTKPFELLREAIAHDPDTHLGIDVAASKLYHEGLYFLNGEAHSRKELLALYKDLVERFDIRTIEDPFDAHDLEGFQAVTKALGEKALIVGDDLTVTSPELVRRLAFGKAGNALVIKPNDVGTISEVYAAAQIARSAGWELIAAHRLGETSDTFLSDLAVGLGCFGIKAGAPTQKENRVKYERLTKIGKEFFANMPRGK